MIRAAKKVSRHGIRDGGIILLMFRHGLRTAELVALKWTQIDLADGYIEVHRVKADAFASSASVAGQMLRIASRTAFILYVRQN